MVKNLPTVERSTKIRFGKNATEDQGENTIVFNASNVQFDATQPGSVYISPLRQVLDVSDRQIKILTYNRISKEVTDSGVAAVDVLQPNLQATTNLGNTTTNTIEFRNPETGFVTTANVGIANTLASHTLSVGSNLYVDDVASNVLVVNGNTNINGDIVVQGNAQIDGVLTVINTENLTITDAIIELGRNNTVGDATTDLGIVMNRPGSNVTVGFLEGTDELALAYTETSAESKTITPLTSETLDVHVYGRVLTESNVGIINTSPIHTLDVGSNLFVDEYGSNVLVVSGNTSVSGNFTVDEDTFHVDVGGKSIGLGTVSPDANLHVVGNVYVSSNLTVDEDTLHVDATTNSVGIETKNPQANLHVVGNVYVSSNLTVDENTFHVDTTTHSVGVETNSPDANLHVVGNVYVSSNLTVDEDTFHVDTTTHCVGIETKNPQANLHVVGNTYISDDLTVATDTFHVDATTNSVGIKTKTPDAELHVVGNVYVSSNLTVDEDTLHVDATTNSVGVETKNPKANLHVVGNVYVSSNLTVDEDTFHVDATTNSVGIETKSPDAELHVVGNVYVSSDLTVDTDTLHVDAATDSVGVGTVNPTSNFHVAGNAYVSSNTTTDGTLTLNHPTTAILTDLTSNVEVKLNQLANVSIDTPVADQLLVYNGADWINENPLHTYIRIRNDAGVDLSRGDVVYVTGSHNQNVVKVGLARADSPSTMPAIGVVNDATIIQGGEGVAVAYGRAQSVNTLGFIEGETLYVSNTVAGGLSNVKPFYTDSVPDSIQNVGVVVKVGETNGTIFVTGIGRANDVPNAQIVLDEGDINWVYVSDQNNDFQKIEPSNLLTQLQTFEQVSAAGNVVSNIMSFTNSTTSIVTTSNAIVGGNISVADLTDPLKKHLPMVDSDGFFEKSPVYIEKSSGKYVISASEAEFLGNITLSGNTTILNSESLTISDRIFGVAANNSASGLDSGFMIEHQEGNPLEYANVALIYHADEHRFSISYTQNTFTDDHILHYEDETHRMLIDLRGNVQVQNTFTVNTDTFHVDSVNERVGVLTTSPAYTLDVHGNSNVAVARSKSSVVTDATPAVSKVTGAVTIAGGLGVSGDIHATDVNFENATLDSATIQNTTAATNKTTDALIVTGGVGISGALFGSTAEFDGITKVTNGTASSTKTSGALQVAGGVGIVGDIHATHVNFEDAEVDSLTVTDTTEAFSTVTGAVTIAGGLGVVGNVHAALFYGDGSQLTGLVTTLEDVANNGNTMSNTIIYENTGTSLVTDGNVGIVTRTPDANLHVVGNVHV